jgi:hypothetical protein
MYLLVMILISCIHFVSNSYCVYSFQLIDGKVETDMIAPILDAIPTDSLKTQAADLINKCGKKGNTRD